MLFLHATNDTVCDTPRTRLADPVRQDCARLTEVTVEAGHELMLEAPDQVNTAISDWLSTAARA